MNPQFLYISLGDVINDNHYIALSDPDVQKVVFADTKNNIVFSTASINANRRDSIVSSDGLNYKKYWIIDSNDPTNVYLYDTTGSYRSKLTGSGIMQGLTVYGTPGYVTSNIWVPHTNDFVNYSISMLWGFINTFNLSGGPYNVGPAFDSTIKLYSAVSLAGLGQLYIEGLQQNKLIIYTSNFTGSIFVGTGTCSFNSYGFGGGFAYDYQTNKVFLGAFNEGTGNPEIWEWNPDTLVVDYVYDLTFLKTSYGVTTASSLCIQTSLIPEEVKLYLIDSSGIYGWFTSTRTYCCRQDFNSGTASVYGDTDWTNLVYVPMQIFTGSSSGGALEYTPVL